MSRVTLAALLATVTLASTARLAHADPAAAPTTAPTARRAADHRFYLGTGASLAGDEWLYLTGFVDGGVRIMHTSLWFRARIDHGAGGDFDGTWAITTPAVGLEARACDATKRWCGTIGADVGRMTGRLNEDERHDHDIAATRIAVRAGLELGLTARAAIRVGLDGHGLVGDTGLRNDTVLGADASLGCVLRF